MTSDPRTTFPNFYENPAVRGALASSCRWTISGQVGDDPEKNKAPVDIRELKRTGRLRGAWAADPRCLMTLDELADQMPQAANGAFFLRAQIDGLLVIDIEPSCPPTIATGLLRLPGILYSELSMSGRGYHLIAGLPESFWKHPDAASSTVLREEHGWYEILLEHWITFTRKPIPPVDAADPVAEVAQVAELDEHRYASVADLYERLARRARVKAASSRAIDLDAEEMPEIPKTARILADTTRGWRPAEASRFHGDLSRWEFSVLGSLYSRMLPALISAADLTGHRYTESDQTWLLYQAALEVLPHRGKHDERRNGRPFLLDRAAALVAEREAVRRRKREEVARRNAENSDRATGTTTKEKTPDD